MADEAEGASGTEDSMPEAEAPIEAPVETEAPTTVAEAAAQAEAAHEGSDEPSYTVKVNGEETTVSLEELRSGYMRQADYTQKTQDVAETQRQAETLQRFEARLDENPEETLLALAEAYDLDLGGAAKAEPTDDADTDDEWIDSADESELAKQVRELTEWKKQAEAAQVSEAEAKAMAQIDADLEAVKVDNDDPDLDENELLALAVEKRIPNMQDAYILYRSQNPKTEAASPPPVEGGHNTSPPAPGKDKKMSLDEAFAAAEKALSA